MIATVASPPALAFTADGRVAALVPVAAHDKSLILKIIDLVGGEANLATAGDPLALFHVRRHRFTLSREQMRSVSENE